jgi:hypothetical protein
MPCFRPRRHRCELGSMNSEAVPDGSFLDIRGEEFSAFDMCINVTKICRTIFTHSQLVFHNLNSSVFLQE